MKVCYKVSISIRFRKSQSTETHSKSERRLEGQSQQNCTETSPATEATLERERRLECLRQHATISRAIETSLEHEGWLQSQQNRTETSH